ncbi:hypothetical protein MSC49_03370 [Methylosinus sp. C49]|uniref:helix-turn-helix domain-containing protein n=1 Tax=Methylosinus sp. C49 TaxID=2699395 RepID=UPI00136697D8|nr:helix-turn-helix domain-containing protein [Methylosinus sp. C49]BBU60402.1 hypothetical protein MSC49_03370 [Methylosinus sp. C49]
MIADSTTFVDTSAPVDPARQALVRKMKGEIVITMTEAAQMLRMGVKTLRRKCKRGEITFVVKGGETRPRRMFAVSDLEAFLQKRQDETRYTRLSRPDWMASVRVSHAPKRKSTKG